MTNLYIEISIPVTEQLKKDMLIAELTFIGFEGFEEQKEFLKAFIPADNFNESQLEEVTKKYNLTYLKNVMKDKNWNALWEADFQPVIVDRFCTIRAHFHPPVKGVKYDIIITPKMSFGTGHHATTFMMVKAMSQIDFQEKTVFDFGTGTGVLSILSEKSGASAIMAIDNDSWSIENARENLIQNNCHKVLVSNSEVMPEGALFDVILANINRNVILENMGNFRQHLALNGVLLMSGLLSDDQLIIMQEAERHSLVLMTRLEKDGWICLGLQCGEN